MTDWNEAPHFHSLRREDIRRTRAISAQFSEGDGMDRRPMTAGQMRAAAGVPETQGFDDDRSGDELRAVKRQITAALSELGQPTPETPAPVRVAIDLLRAAIGGSGRLSHPESDTRGLDWPTLANVIREVDGNHDLGAGELAERILTHPKVRRASPDLSIDREGLALAMYAEAMGCTDAEAREWWADDSPAANQRELRKADRLLARYAALRGTTQPEPTE